MKLQTIAAIGALVGAASAILRVAVQPVSFSPSWVMIAAGRIAGHALALAMIFVVIALVFDRPKSHSS